jgi:hypothetical protein
MALNDRSLKLLRLENLQKINMGNRRTKNITADFRHLDNRFVGTFVVHYASQMENIEIGVIRTELLMGNQNVDNLTDNLVTALATLEVVLDAFPDWFNPYDEKVEYEILEYVFVEYITWVNSFRTGRERVSDGGNSQDQPSEIRVVDTENVPRPTN